MSVSQGWPKSVCARWTTPDKSLETINHPMPPTTNAQGGLLSYTSNSIQTQVTFPWFEKNSKVGKKVTLEKNVDILYGRFCLPAVDFPMAGEKKRAHLSVTRLGAGTTHSNRDLTRPWLVQVFNGD